jgi:hypothetical protein
LVAAVPASDCFMGSYTPLTESCQYNTLAFSVHLLQTAKLTIPVPLVSRSYYRGGGAETNITNSGWKLKLVVAVTGAIRFFSRLYWSATVSWWLTIRPPSSARASRHAQTACGTLPQRLAI